VEDVSGGGQGDAGRQPVEQDGTELGLQQFDGSAERRLGHVQTESCTPNVTFLGTATKYRSMRVQIREADLTDPTAGLRAGLDIPRSQRVKRLACFRG